MAAVAAVVVAPLVLVVSACGGGDDHAAGHALRLDAVPGGALRFEHDRVTGPAGRAVVEMANPSAIPHAIALRGQGVTASGDTVGQGGTSRFVVDADPGTYKLYCPVAAHEAAGMIATLTIP